MKFSSYFDACLLPVATRVADVASGVKVDMWRGVRDVALPKTRCLRYDIDMRKDMRLHVELYA